MIISCGLVFINTFTTIGMRIPKVPQEVPVEIETRVVESPRPGMLAMETYRKVYNEDKSQVFIEKVADSSYIN